jgi:hypothetical protein
MIKAFGVGLLFPQMGQPVFPQMGQPAHTACGRAGESELVMAKVYVSSTFEDLREYRDKVRLVLHQLGHVDVAMETYVAEPKRPLEKCLQDVAACELYVGIFAWRYGYVPPGQDRSITELEYNAAIGHNKECFIFLLKEDALWPPKYIDSDRATVARLRRELSKGTSAVSFPHRTNWLP